MIAPLLQGQNLLQCGQTNGVSCPLSIIADFTFPIFDGVKPVALLAVRTSIPVLVRWCVGMLVCCYAGMWIDHHACQCFSGMQPVNSGTNTAVFLLWNTCIANPYMSISNSF